MDDLEFDPNNKQPPTIEWATYIPGREPKFKTHNGRGQALNAFQYRDAAILYRYDFDKGEWVEVYREDNPERPDNCEICNTSLVSERRKWTPDGYEYVPHKFFYLLWVDRDTSPHRITVCGKCRRENR